MDSVAACLSHTSHTPCAPLGLGACSALLTLLSCCVLVSQRCRVRGAGSEELSAPVYCFLGNLCSGAGAVLSQQLFIQVVMGVFAAAVDVVNMLSMFWCWNSKEDKRLRMIRKRRRQYQLAVCVLLGLGGGCFSSKAGSVTAERAFTHRRLLQAVLQDNTEVLGYVLGLLSCVIACTSKFPAVSRAHRRETFTRAHVFSGALCSLAGTLYAAAILSHDTRSTFLLKATPWLLSALCCAALDLLILLMLLCRKGARRHPQRSSPDRESLLRGSELIHMCGSLTIKKLRKQQSKKNDAHQKAEIGHYMDVNVHSARKVCMEEATLPGEVASGSGLMKIGGVDVVRVDGLSSSSSSYDSSSVSSDLEVSTTLFGEMVDRPMTPPPPLKVGF